jgi:phosphohistidine phosphatase
MHIYLVRHGIAAGGGDDPPLTDAGIAAIEGLAAVLACADVKPRRVIHSPLQRARQTARLLSAVVALDLTPEEAASGLYPDDSTDAIAAAVDGWREDVMLVGHTSNISRLAARLMSGLDDGVRINFERGTVVCLERTQAGYAWGLNWSIAPRISLRQFPR